MTRPFRGKDLVGNKYGMLTVIKFNRREDDGRGHYKYLWDCQCDCGNCRTIRVEQLVYANFVSCGCQHKKRKKYNLPNFIDITGNKYSRLEVKEYLGNGNGLWLCQCDCGKITKCSKYELETGQKKSCGCWKDIKNRQKRKNNLFIEYDNYIMGKDECDREFYFDKEDFEKIKNHYWTVNYNNYVISNYDNNKFLLHRIIMNAHDDDVIDHINHINYDNRKCNLRLCTDHQNVCNKKIAKNNKSGKTGVCKERNKWHAYIFYNGKTIHLGRFENFDDVVKVRIDKEIELFGEFSPYYNKDK